MSSSGIMLKKREDHPFPEWGILFSTKQVDPTSHTGFRYSEQRIVWGLSLPLIENLMISQSHILWK